LIKLLKNCYVLFAMAEVLDGKSLANKILSRFEKNGANKLLLATILVGNNAPSRIYVNMKQKKCESVGIKFELKEFPETVQESEILTHIKNLNQRTDVSGILLQLPLPKNLNTRKILDSINPSKDVDGLTSKNLGLLVSNQESMISCTAKGVIKLLESYNIDVEGKHVVIVGHSFLVGRPLAELFLNRNATVTVCHDKTTNLKEHTVHADILVSATGIPHLITEEMVAKDAIVIDVGISKLDGKIVGDVDFDSVKGKASYITPVPGGVGPMTIAMLIENVLSSTHGEKVE
jgi:methylenetetrahydrofolate dehydrogenase (NADP+)/methenyltetrahydrofolate cyclohydrolase